MLGGCQNIVYAPFPPGTPQISRWTPMVYIGMHLEGTEHAYVDPTALVGSISPML